MKAHPTEDNLIEYQFELLPEGHAKEIGEHLADCADCRQRLAGLKDKLSTLDLLRDDEGAISDSLLSETLERAAIGSLGRKSALKPPLWIGSAAAILIIGVILLTFQSQKGRRDESKVVKSPSMSTEDMDPRALDEQARPVESLKKELTAQDKPAAVGSAVGSDAAAKARMDSYPDSVLALADEIAEKPPFAPASAIELVTLPRRDNVQITIYNSADLTLVRERRDLTLKRGWNWLQFMWANTLIDPTSLSLEPLAHNGQIDIQQMVYPARLKDIGRWLIRSEVSGQVPFEITYMTSGLSWRAFYMGTLSEDEKTMDLSAYVRVANNSGEDYEDAQTRLIVGKVHILDQIAELAQRQYPYGRPEMSGKSGSAKGGWVSKYYWRGDGMPMLGDTLEMGYMDFDGLERKEIKKEGLSEYFLYTIEGTETIPDKWGKRLPSFEAEDVPVDSLYKYDENRWASRTMRFVAFANDAEHELGETPIPDGTMRIFSQADGDGHLSHVGAAGVKYIPVNEEIELNMGAARLVKVEPVLMDIATENYQFDPRGGDIVGFDEVRTWKIEIANARDLGVELEITRDFATSYWDMADKPEDVDYTKHDATRARFKLKLGPRTKRSFTYTVRTYNGTRQQAYRR